MPDQPPLKPLDEACRDISAMRNGAGIHVIQIFPSGPGADVDFNCEQASFSGDLAKNYSEEQVLFTLCQVLDATLQYYADLLHQARARRASREVIVDEPTEK